ncbi:tetratricopeptide repeat protein [Phenylobacterium sp. LjRoot219]|uniref:tetratricopeptide repeat protein n=1 Tax=Phenylobacterium sp. LjRoot219 TaxID=3342283 RepID=UPI003ECFF979
MSDLFHEVEEQLRSDRYRTLARKVLPWLLGLAAVALIAGLGWWGWSHFREQAIHKASEQYAAGLDAAQQGQTDQAVKIFTEVSKSQAKGYKSLALLQLGGFRLEKKDAAGAVKLFDEAAAAAPSPVLADAARLKSAFALLDTAPAKDVEARLTPLLEDGRPYRVQAREALAFTKLTAGNLAGARGDFVIISGMLDAPEGARARAKAAIGLIDSGSAKAVAQTARAAAALPPTAIAPAMPELPQAPGPQ